MNFPVFHTDSLLLRKLGVDDFPTLIRFANNRNISDHIVNIPYPFGEPEAAFRLSHVVSSFKRGTHYVLAIIHNVQDELAGEIALNLDPQGNGQLGYWVAEPYWGQGIASEAVEAMLRFGFDQLKLERIFAICHQDNVASQRVVLKNGLWEQGRQGRNVHFAMGQREFILARGENKS